MKDHEEEICLPNSFGNEMGSTATVESDTKQPGEHHDTYRTIT